VWLKTATLAVTADVLTPPLGVTTMWKVNDPDGVDNFLYRVETVDNDSLPHAISIYLSQGTAAVTRFDAALSGGSGVASVTTITWATGVVGGSNPGTLEDAGGGIFRLKLVLTNNASGNTSLTVALRPADITAANTGYVYASGAQWEQASAVSDYIYTGGEVASRLAYTPLDPLIKMRSYRDGVTPGPWREASLGSIGQYGKEVRWNRCGQFKAPGALFEFEVSDPVVIRINDVRVNVP